MCQQKQPDLGQWASNPIPNKGDVYTRVWPLQLTDQALSIRRIRASNQPFSVLDTDMDRVKHKLFLVGTRATRPTAGTKHATMPLS